MQMNHSPDPRTLPRVRFVRSFDELVSTPFAEGVNALCWRREMEGDFAAVVGTLDVGAGITSMDAETLRGLSLSLAGQRAVEQMLGDFEMLSAHGLLPSLDCVNGYAHALQEDALRTDVCSFHADSATAEADTYLCTYHGACSWGLLNEHAVRKVDLPSIRARLLEIFGGTDDEAFQEWLEDHYHDLHYRMLPTAVPYAFGSANLWRIATAWPGSPVPPCIHRAPDPIPGQKRLLLIS